MFFDGDTSQRKVSLRGASKVEDKKHFLERTQKERANRELQRRRENGSLRIQSFFRGRRDIAKQRNIERTTWDQSISVYDLDAKPPAVPPVQDLLKLLRQFTFFYRDSADDERLWKMCQMMLASLESADPTKNYLSLVHIDIVRGIWVHQVKKLLGICQRKMTSPKTYTLRLLFLLSGGINLNLPNPEQSTIYGKICVHLVKTGLYGYLHAFIKKAMETQSTPPQDKPSLTASITLSIRPLQFGLPLLPPKSTAKSGATTKETLAWQFVEYILSVPYLTAKCGPTSLQAILQNVPTTFQLCDTPQLSMPDEKAISILGNLLDFAPKIDYTVVPSYSKMLCNIATALKHLIIPAKPQDEDDDAPVAAGSGMDIDITPLQHHLQRLCEPQRIRHLFSSFMPAQTQSPTTRQALSQGLVSLAKVYNIVIRGSLATERTNVLNTIAFAPPSTSPLSALWRFVTEYPSFDEFVYHPTSDKYEDLCSVLSLFCRCYGRLLMALDDEDFFKKQQYFTLKQILAMIGTLKAVVVRMYWGDKKRELYIDTDLRDDITNLLTQLYDRNSRHSFCPAGYWLAPEIDMPTFAEQVETNDAARKVLENIPFVIPNRERVRIFNNFILKEKEEYQREGHIGGVWVKIRRDFVFEDGFAALNPLREKLKSLIKVEFISSSGLPEAGIDGGGVFKEFLTALTKTAFDPQYGLFKETEQHHIYPNPSSHFTTDEYLQQYEFLGRVLGKALFENTLVDLHFAAFFLSKLIKKQSSVNDLIFLDPLMHSSLMKMKNYEGNIEDLCLYFSVIDDEMGQPVVKDLIPGGRDIPVTNENLIKYIHLAAHYKLNVQMRKQSEAFLRGFTDLIKPEWIRMFNQEELQLLISGIGGPLDLQDMRANTHYSGGYADHHPVIQMFWQVVAEFSVEEQRNLLKFVTSCSRPPFLGFSSLQPNFAIHKADTGGDESFLPTAATCMNFLKLPPYKSKETMRNKLLYAINAGAGFELS